MAKTDWAQLNAEFLQEHEATGISAKDWCDSRGLNYNSARRYLKSRGQSPAQSDKSRVAAQSAHSEVRKTAQSAQSAQAKGNEAKAKGGERRGERSSASPHTSADSAQNPKTNGRDSSGRFTEGNPGNPNPVTKWKPGDRPALTHGGYAKFLDAEELFDQARELQLRDELEFTRARVISVTQLLKGLQQDLVTATEMTDRIALYDKILKAEQALDRNIQRIESIERTLSALMVDAVNVPKIEEDTRRIRAATRKLTAEADRLEKDGGSEATPVSEMVSELHDMGTGGLMS
ncbi:terminase [Aeromonas hydrophila]|uniref:terminase n=1 Tax=Aeromonas hydrophila TaxID=644 RepID=UPI001B3A548C|nr:terminase [Aeromonas hydrophila]MBQ4676992.1 terminase [Aeromonas hydrophila]MBW3813595.1 terminase [Aeromonas hydrophila]MCF7678826.1 terminase [Aeromonas hydrophila]MCF7691874.1 terminase [Aeromonas hydrophila]MCF7772674.1 terminase [Aeromonas hydrophila]